MTAPGSVGLVCPKCGTGIAPGLLRCPSCRALVFADQLARLAAAAEAATAETRLAEATHAWQEALHLLPEDAAQREAIRRKLEVVGARMEQGEGRAPKPPAPRRGVLAAIGAAIVFLLTKAKLVLLGLMKAGALLSLFAFLGVYWREWGWVFAAGMVVSIYIHELGHVVALRRYGIPVSAPMFVPGLGAYVRHGALPTDRIGSRVALAGPAGGLVAAAIALGLFYLTGERYWAALAYLGAMINLGNLIPVWQLDGVRGVAPLSTVQRILFAAALGTVAIVARDAPTGVIAVAAGGALIFLGWGKRGDRVALLYALGVIGGLGVVLTLAK